MCKKRKGFARDPLIQGERVSYKLLMNIKIMSGKVKRANNEEKRPLIKAYIKMQRADVVCIQETKWETTSEVGKERIWQ